MLGAEGGSVLRSDVTVAPAAGAAPATLAATSVGTTTVGLSATSASTSYSPALFAQDLLDVDGDGHDWSVRLEILSLSGGGALDSVTLRLCDPPASCLTQVTVSGTSITKTTGLPVTLETGEMDVTVQSTATKVSLGALVLELQLVFTPPGGSAPEFRYDYTVTMP